MFNHKKCCRCGKRITEFEARHNQVDEDAFMCNECVDMDGDDEYFKTFIDEGYI